MLTQTYKLSLKISYIRRKKSVFKYTFMRLLPWNGVEPISLDNNVNHFWSSSSKYDEACGPRKFILYSSNIIYTLNFRNEKSGKIVSYT